MSDFLEACLAAAKAAEPNPSGMIISDGNWQVILQNAQRVKPRADGLMEFCGFKVRVSELIPDHTIVWTDNQGVPLHIQDLRGDEQPSE